MKTGGLFSAIGFLLLVGFFLLLRGRIWFRTSTIDIHLFDTYFVVTYLHFLLFIGFVLGTFFFIGAVVATGFRNGYFVGVLLALVLADAFMVWKLKDLFW